jgi:hypothetical protein
MTNPGTRTVPSGKSGSRVATQTGYGVSPDSSMTDNPGTPVKIRDSPTWPIGWNLGS